MKRCDIFGLRSGSRSFTRLSALTGSVILLGAAPAMAQEAGSETAPLQDIIVTAQRRAESAQTVPIAVSVVSGQTLARAGVVNLSNITALSPSVTFTSGFEARDNSIRIRGIGSDNSSVGVDSSISTVLDGVVLQRPGAAFADLIDIDRVEILRGPQGTLFGKNSVAGVVNVVTKNPNFDHVEGNVGLTLAEDREARLTAVYSAPLSEKVAFRIAGLARTQRGIVYNVFTGHHLNGSKAYSTRAKLSFRPSEVLEFRVSADYSYLDSSLGASPLIAAGTSAIVPTPKVAIGPENDRVDNDVDSFAKQKNYGGSIETNLKIGDHTLTLIDALRYFNNRSDFDADNTRARLILSFGNTEKSRTMTHELRLTSPTGGLIDYVGGVLYFDGKVSNFLDRRGYTAAAVKAVDPITGQITPINPANTTAAIIPSAAYASVDTINVGVYGQVNVHPTSKLTLTGGLRHIYEKNKFSFNRSLVTNSTGVPGAPALVGGFDYRDNAYTGKASASYRFTRQIMLYGGYSTGYTGKATNSGAALTVAEFNNGPAAPMTSNQWEGGLKTELFDGRLRANLTAFRTRYKNYQATVTRISDGLRALTNAGTVGIDGAEVELTAAPTHGLLLSGGVTYLDARFVDSRANCYVRQTAALGCIIQPAANGVPAVAYQVLDGKPFLNAPKWRYTISARQEFEVGDNIANIQLGYRWQSKVNFDLSQDPRRSQGAYGIADASIGLSTMSGKVEYGLFVKNLFDRQYPEGVQTFNGVFAGNAPTYAQQISRDFHRYIGGTVRVSW